MTRLYLRARHLAQVLAVVLLLQLALALLAARALTFTINDRHEAIPIAALAQFIVVSAALFTCRAATTTTEAIGARTLLPQRVVLLTAVVASCLASAAILAATTSSDPAAVGTTGPWVTLRNQAGLLGIGLLAARIIDPRIAGVVPASLVVLPFVLPPQHAPTDPVWAFTLMPQPHPIAATTAIVLLICGYAVHLRPALARSAAD